MASQLNHELKKSMTYPCKVRCWRYIDIISQFNYCAAKTQFFCGTPSKSQKLSMTLDETNSLKQQRSAFSNKHRNICYFEKTRTKSVPELDCAI